MLTDSEYINFLEQKLNIKNNSLLDSYKNLIEWLLSLNDNKSLIKIVPHITGKGKSRPDIRFTIINEVNSKKKKNFLILKYGGNLQFYIPIGKEYLISHQEFNYKRIKGNNNIIEYNSSTAISISLAEKIELTSIAYCLLLEHKEFDNYGSCSKLLKTIDADQISIINKNEESDKPQKTKLSEEKFDVNKIQDERNKTIGVIKQRQGQPNFRKKVREAYSDRCAITGYNVVEALEAAHIIPYLGGYTNAVENGLLLRADIHTLFDLGLISIDTDGYRVVVSSQLDGSNYENLKSKLINLPSSIDNYPDIRALDWHRKEIFKE